MTAQEQQMLQGLTDRINKTPLAEKDPDAEQYLQQTLGRNPDALYILAQTVLVQQYALEQAQKQLSDARAELDQAKQQAAQPKHATSFLGNLLGMNDEQPQQRQTPPPPPPPPSQYGQPAYAPVPQYGQSQYGQPQYGPPPAYGPPAGYGQPQSGSFLRSAMQTATGVAAGALAFEGIESLMHGFGGSSGFSSGISGGRPEEIVNNYYGDSSPHEHSDHLSSDIEDRRTDSSSFTDAVDRDDHHDGKQGLMDDSSADDASTYDNSADDTSSIDDSSDFSGDDSSYNSDDNS